MDGTSMVFDAAWAGCGGMGGCGEDHLTPSTPLTATEGW